MFHQHSNLRPSALAISQTIGLNLTFSFRERWCHFLGESDGAFPGSGRREGLHGKASGHSQSVVDNRNVGT